MLFDMDVKDTTPTGDWAADGGSEGRKEAGEDGGAAKGTTGARVELLLLAAEASLRVSVGSGTRTA